MFASTTIPNDDGDDAGCFSCGRVMGEDDGDNIVEDDPVSGGDDNDDGDDNDEYSSGSCTDLSQTQYDINTLSDTDDVNSLFPDFAFVSSLDEESEYYSMQLFRKYHGPVADTGHNGLLPGPSELCCNPCQPTSHHQQEYNQRCQLEIPSLEMPSLEIPTLELPNLLPSAEDGGLTSLTPPVTEGCTSAMQAIDQTVDSFVGFFLPLRPDHPYSRSASVRSGAGREKTKTTIKPLRPRIEVEADLDGTNVVYSTTERMNLPRFVTLVKKIDNADGYQERKGILRLWTKPLASPAPIIVTHAQRESPAPNTKSSKSFWRMRRKEPLPNIAITRSPSWKKNEAPMNNHKSLLGRVTFRSDDNDCDLRSLGSLTTQRSWNLTETSTYGSRRAVNLVPPDGTSSTNPSKIGLQIFAPVHVSKTLVYLDEVPPPDGLSQKQDQHSSSSSSVTSAVAIPADEASYHTYMEEDGASFPRRYVTEEEKTVTDGDSSIHTIRILRVPTEETKQWQRTTSWSKNSTESGIDSASKESYDRRTGKSMPTSSGRPSQYVTENEKTVTDGDASIHMIRLWRVPTSFRLASERSGFLRRHSSRSNQSESA